MNVSFAYPVYIWLPLGVLAVGLAALALLRLERRRARRVALFVDTPLVARLQVGYSPRLRKPLAWLTMLGFAFLVFAIAQPHWGQAWQQITKRGRDVLIVLDTSESMNATDPLPTRLERAKYKISALMDRQPGDRYGLITFSGAAVLVCPPTLDHGYFLAVLKAVDTSSISVEGTDIAAALGEAADTFREYSSGSDDVGRDNRAILLISDGEDLGEDTIKAAQEAGKYARIYVMGVGNPDGTPIPVPPNLLQRSGGGEREHISKLDEATLIEIAKTGDGRYVRSEADDWDLDKLTEFMAQVEARGVSSDVRMRLINRYQWPLGLAILFFVSEGLWWAIMPMIRHWRQRRPAEMEEAPRHA